MRTIIETLTIAAEHFEKAGVDSPRLTAEVLLADTLQCNRIDLYLRFDQPLTEKERGVFGEKYRRRLAREPLQYILGTASFCGLQFETSPDVLIPRPETEELTEEVAIVLNSFSSRPLRVLDIGTGSGCIAITLAARFPHASVTAIDISSEAIAVATRNAERIEKNNIIFFTRDVFNDDFLEGIVNDGKFDVIISNPPYVSREEFPMTQTEVRDFEPRIAVTDNADGLTFYRRIAAIARGYLQNNGILAFEVGAGQAGHVQEILRMHGFDVKVKKDIAGIERIVIGSMNI